MLRFSFGSLVLCKLVNVKIGNTFFIIVAKILMVIKIMLIAM